MVARCASIISTRQLYATDASIYEMQPLGVAFPRSARSKPATSSVQAAKRASRSRLVERAPVCPAARLATDLIVDFSRHNRAFSGWISTKHVRGRCRASFLISSTLSFDHTVSVLARTWRPVPRATLGGMIANNSSGARVPIYGTTADHVALAGNCFGGRTNRDRSEKKIMRFATERSAVEHINRDRTRAEITERMPPGLLKTLARLWSRNVSCAAEKSGRNSGRQRRNPRRDFFCRSQNLSAAARERTWG